MDVKSFLECERNKLQKFLDFQLPNYCKRIGFIVFVISFLILLFLKFTSLQQEAMRLPLRFAMLIGLLFVSISKDKEEDEMVKLLRSQSYVMAFISGVLYAIIQPLANYFVNVYVKEEPKEISSLGDFQVLLFMLLVQVFIFMYLKKMR